MRLQFRAEFYNMLNHPIMGAPSAGITSSTFGDNHVEERQSHDDDGAAAGVLAERGLHHATPRFPSPPCCWPAARRLPPRGDPDPSTLDKKVLFGYQGWFNCAGDGAPENNWRSWSRGVPAAETLTVDMYPDLSEFDRADLCAVPGMTIGGKQAYLSSAWNPKMVARHFRWMKEYGLDGVLMQRFVTQYRPQARFAATWS